MFDSGIETVKETVLSLKEKVTGIDFDAIKDKVVSLKNTVSILILIWLKKIFLL